MALQKGERCCGKEEGPAGITCCFCMCGQLWAPPATRGWEKQENLFRTPKKQSSLFSQRITGAHMGRMKPQREKPRRCSLSGQCSLVPNHPVRQPQAVTGRMQRHEDTVVRLRWPPWALGGCAPLGHLLWWKLQQVSPFQGYSQYQRWFKKQVDFSLQCNCCNNLCF